jgi:hypothetical protein
MSDTWVDTEIVTITKLHTLLRDKMRTMWHEKAYVQYTAAVTVASVTSTSPTLVVSSGALTYEAVPHEIEFFSPWVQVNPSDVVYFSLWDDTTDMGLLGIHGSTGTTDTSPAYFTRKLFPTAGSHTYKVMVYASANAGSHIVGAGAGGVNVTLPGYIRVMAKGDV